MRGIVTFGSTVVAAALIIAGGALAATPTSGQQASDIGFVWATTRVDARFVAVVGCDGAYPQQRPRVQVLDARSGAVVWNAPLGTRNGCIRAVLAAGDDLFVSGDFADDDRDRGRNLIVRRYSARDGALLWEQDFEAPDPTADMVNTLRNAPNLVLAGQRLMVWSGSTSTGNPSVLLRLDRATGALLPPAP